MITMTKTHSVNRDCVRSDITMIMSEKKKVAVILSHLNAAFNTDCLLDVALPAIPGHYRITQKVY